MEGSDSNNDINMIDSISEKEKNLEMELQKVRTDKEKLDNIRYLQDIISNGSAEEIKAIVVYHRRKSGNGSNMDARQKALQEVYTKLGIVRGRGKLEGKLQAKVNAEMSALGFPPVRLRQ